MQRGAVESAASQMVSTALRCCPDRDRLGDRESSKS
jgi:hypothetical protein